MLNLILIGWMNRIILKSNKLEKNSTFFKFNTKILNPYSKNKVQLFNQIHKFSIISIEEFKIEKINVYDSYC